ncbi:MAG: DUF6913 domain-containing protein [Flavobacteriales bacterium]
MKFLQFIKRAFGGRILRKEMEPVRLRGGANFRSAKAVGIVYTDVDRETYDQLHEYGQHLKAKYDIKAVHTLAFVNSKEKKLPDYQRQLVHAEYFTRSDLNWHMRPVNNVSNFLQQPFDILIDFSGGNVVPLNFIMKESLAKMKVGLRGTKTERYCDFIIDMGDQFGMDKFIEQLDLYLSNSRIK